MRKLTVLGNWKMHLTWEEAGRLAREVREKLECLEELPQVGVCPSFPLIAKVKEELEGSPIRWGGQNLYPRDEGAYTGEVSGKMLRSLGCEYVILGHSERRRYFGETNEFIREKIASALSFHLVPILCVGETLEERQRKQAFTVVETQLRECLEGFSEGILSSLVIAYEPVWAIGTGVAAKPEDAEQMHLWIREVLAKLYSSDFAQSRILLYGGSVSPQNAYSLASQPNVDGALVGGASLKAESFTEIVLSMQKAKRSLAHGCS